jgi:queuine tRNA-ribosyltransferase
MSGLNHQLNNNQLVLKNQTYDLPLYFPDATLGVVRSLSSIEVANLGIQGAVINTYHLKDRPGIRILNKLGGIKQLMNWPGLTASDSGGFQLFSLIQKDSSLGKITDKGVVLYSGKNRSHKHLFTPEDSIKVQFAINSDMMICLDDFTPDDAGQARIEKSVERTLNWAKRCKQEFERQLEKNDFNQNNRPILIAPIQGHRNKQLRKKCAEGLLKIGFDGYGLGGWPFVKPGVFDYETCAYNASLTPDNKLRFALGIGSPENIVELTQMGYHIFDCVLPTRDARHQRLYIFKQDPDKIDLFAQTNQEQKPDWYDYVYINRGAFKTDQTPLSNNCDCFTCQHHSRAYLNHLFKAKDTLAYRLATTHNLRFYARLMRRLQQLTA